MFRIDEKKLVIAEWVFSQNITSGDERTLTSEETAKVNTFLGEALETGVRLRGGETPI